MDRPTLTDGVLRLRAPRLSDVDRITAACQDPETQRWALALPRPYRREHAVAFVEQSAAEAAGGTAFSYVAVGGDDRVVAALHVGDGEMGYWVAPDARGRGVATRAVTLLRDWARDALGLERIEMQIHPDNAASCRVAEKAGFADSGERRIPDRGSDPEPHAVYVWSAA
jgi:RimJ/RimL family protein N-acetyltransferase